MRGKNLCVHGEDAKRILAYSPNTLRYFPRILHRCLNTFRVFSVYAERMKNTQREFFPINNAWGLQRESVSKKSNGGLYACLG